MNSGTPREERSWREIMADVDRVHGQVLWRTGHPFDVDADIAELRGRWSEPRPRMTAEELQAWSEGLKQLHQEMRSRPGWEDIDVDEELYAMREERYRRLLGIDEPVND